MSGLPLLAVIVALLAGAALMGVLYSGGVPRNCNCARCQARRQAQERSA